MGKCESAATSMNDLSGMVVGAIDINRPARLCLSASGGSGEPPLPYRNPRARKSSRGSSKLQLPNEATNLRRYCTSSTTLCHSRQAKSSWVDETEFVYLPP